MTYLNIYEVAKSDSGKTSIFNVVNSVNSIILGIIRWHGAWRKYVFEPLEDTIYDSGCLKEIIQFIDDEMNKRK